MNWGKGIVGGMIIFMLFILSMCFYMFRAPADEYDHQYYEKGLNFDRDQAREQQVYTDHAEPKIGRKGNALLIAFNGRISGKIRFIRPSSVALDRSFPLNSGSDNMVSIPLNDIKAGQWQLVLEWQSNNKSYLYQKEMYIK